MRLDYSSIAYILDKRETHISHGGSSVHASLFLHLEDDVFDHLFLVLSQVKSVFNEMVTLDYLTCSKTHWNTCTLCVVFNEMHYAMDCSMYGSSMLGWGAEVLTTRLFLVVGYMDSMLY